MKIRFIASWLLVTLVFIAPVASIAAAQEKTGSTEVHSPGNEAGQVGQQQSDDDEEDSNAPKATKEELQGVRNELQVLRDQWQRGIDKTVVSTKRFLALSGSGQVQYSRVFDEGDNPSNATTFKVNSFILNFKGNLKKDYEEGKNLDYSLGANLQSSGSVALTDANLSYQLFNSLDKEGPRLSITAGQQKKEFGLEATATEEFKPTISGAQFASKLSLDERDVGIVLAGDLFPSNDYGFNYRVPAVKYTLGLVNGTGPNKADNNDEKDFFARAAFNAPVNYGHPLRGLTLGGSFYSGRKSYTATNTTTNTITNTTGQTVSSSSTENVIKDDEKKRWGVDLSYVNTPVGFTLEFVKGKDLLPTNGKVKNGTTVTPVGFKEVTGEGTTFTLFYNFGEQFVNSIKTADSWNDWYPLTYQPFYRFDRWVPDTGDRGTRTDIHTYGFNWFFAPTTKLQINYLRKIEHPTDIKDNQLLAQFQFGF